MFTIAQILISIVYYIHEYRSRFRINQLPIQQSAADPQLLPVDEKSLRQLLVPQVKPAVQ